MFAIQYKQQARTVVSYRSFRAKIECMLRADVLPFLARGRPNVVVFDEDIGLATLGTGSRGAVARDFFTRPDGPSCVRLGPPCGALGALAAVTAAYGGPLAAYRQRLPGLGGLSLGFVAATDTVVRSFMGAFSALARRHHLYLIGSADVRPSRSRPRRPTWARSRTRTCIRARPRCTWPRRRRSITRW